MAGAGCEQLYPCCERQVYVCWDHPFVGASTPAIASGFGTKARAIQLPAPSSAHMSHPCRSTNCLTLLGKLSMVGWRPTGLDMALSVISVQSMPYGVCRDW